MENNILISTEHLAKQYPVGGHFFTALDDVNLTFASGEFTGLVGPSGSGKTTLLNIIGALDNPTEGVVLVLEKDTKTLTHKQAAHLRSIHLGFIFQTYNLLPVYSVYENVEFPLLLLDMPPKDRRAMVMQALEWVGLSDKISSRPSQLSGGGEPAGFHCPGHGQTAQNRSGRRAHRKPGCGQLPQHSEDDGHTEPGTGNDICVRIPRRKSDQLFKAHHYLNRRQGG